MIRNDLFLQLKLAPRNAHSDSLEASDHKAEFFSSPLTVFGDYEAGITRIQRQPGNFCPSRN